MAEPKRKGRSRERGARKLVRKGRARRPARKAGFKMTAKWSTASKASNPHRGSTVDAFLHAEGIYSETSAIAVKEVLAWQLVRLMEEQQVSKAELARRMGTSRAAVDRLLDPANESATLLSIARAASVLGRELRLDLVRGDES